MGKDIAKIEDEIESKKVKEERGKKEWKRVKMH